MIDETVFTIMVIMALVTTLMAGPALRALGAARPPAPAGEGGVEGAVAADRPSGFGPVAPV
ncbi:MAG: hypothetical protein V9G12_23230 [Microthrixaceae bacterium]